MTRGWRGHLVESGFILVIALLGILVGGYIFAHQKVTAPGWVPVIGQSYYKLEARFTSASGVMPGQGQTVTIAGINVGKVKGIRLDQGNAVVTMQMEEKYKNRIFPDATMLLRPKTTLKDMVIELDPGHRASGPPLKPGTVLNTSATAPDVNFDEIMATLDTDTRASLAMLLGEAGTAIGGQKGGRALARALRRFEPLSRNGKTASELLATREASLQRVITNLGLVTKELGSNDAQLAQFVTESNQVFKRFSAQNENIGKTLDALPGALDSTNVALQKAGRLSVTLEDGLSKLEPTTKNLAPAIKQIAPFSRRTTPVLQNQLRPFARDAQPVARKLVPVADQLAKATPDLDRFTGFLNNLFDSMAYDPPGNSASQQSFLFSLPWANHNSNSAASVQDGVGPLSRGVLLWTCGSLQLVDNVLKKNNPTLNILAQLLSSPSFADPKVCNSSETTK